MGWDYRLTMLQSVFAAVVVAIAVAGISALASKPPKVQQVKEDQKDVSRVVTPKGDREAVRPVIIRTIPIVPQPKPEWLVDLKSSTGEEPLSRTVEEPVSPPEPPEPERRHWHIGNKHVSIERDVCALHHMHKVYIHNGKSWRCQ